MRNVRWLVFQSYNEALELCIILTARYLSEEAMFDHVIARLVSGSLLGI